MLSYKSLMHLVVIALFVSLSSANYCAIGYYNTTNGDCKSCPSNCQICRTQNQTLACYSCVEGYYVDISTMKCQPCIQNCKECQLPDGQCQICFDNYLYNRDTNRCEEQKRNGNGVVICIKGYFNKNGLCLQCPAFCTECDDYGTCLSCQDRFYVGYYEAYYVSRVQCDLCQLPCKTCTSATECIQKYDTEDLYSKVSGRGKCKKGEFESLGNGQCVICGAGCTDCNSYGICLQCEDDEFLEDDKKDFPLPYCKPCEVGMDCAEQGSKQSEENCGTGYFQSLADDSCIPCGYACLHCTRTGFCFACSQGYVSVKQGYCILEAQQQERDKNPCQQGQYQDPVTTACKDCKQNCTKCHGWNICEQCLVGFHLAGSDNQCYNITEYKQNQDQVKCYTNYYKSSSNQCLPCDSNCEVCNQDKCLACKVNYTLNYTSWKCVTQQQDSDPTICTNGCAECVTPIVCSRCETGFYYSGALCYHCPSSCPNCVNYEICSYDDDEQQESEPYNPVPIPVPEPESTTICSLGQYLSLYNTCKSCSSHCQRCGSATECLSCSSSYRLSGGFCEINCGVGQYVNSQDTCSLCSNGCYACTSSSHCVQCVQGFSLNSSYQCSGSPCQGGTYRDQNGRCSSCGYMCLSCSNSDTCNQCYPTFFSTEDGYCWKCGTICRTCVSGGECTDEGYNPSGDGCPSGQFLNAYDQCYACRNGCDRCSDAFVCKQCLTGYYLSNGECTPCTYGCTTCGIDGVCLDPIKPKQQQIDYSKVVSDCGHGYYRSSYGLCFMCGPGCDYCDENAVCHRCNHGYYLGSGFCNYCPYPCKSCLSRTQCLSYTIEDDIQGQGVGTITIIVVSVLVAISLAVLGYFIWKKHQQSSKQQLLQQYKEKASHIEIQDYHKQTL